MQKEGQQPKPESLNYALLSQWKHDWLMLGTLTTHRQHSRHKWNLEWMFISLSELEQIKSQSDLIQDISQGYWQQVIVRRRQDQQSYRISVITLKIYTKNHITWPWKVKISGFVYSPYICVPLIPRSSHSQFFLLGFLSFYSKSSNQFWVFQTGFGQSLGTNIWHFYNLLNNFVIQIQLWVISHSILRKEFKMKYKHLKQEIQPFFRGFINISSTMVPGFHRQAKRFELSSFVSKHICYCYIAGVFPATARLFIG